MMNLNSIAKFARSNTPAVKIVNKHGWLRHDVTRLLHGDNNIGIELGVAKGIYARRMIESKKFKRFYGVDIYGDIHDTDEYCQALKYIGFKNPQYSLLRMDFDSASTLFENEYFDFIYIDGFAHAGEEGGRTLLKWYDKLKINGVLAGDDYHDDWPLVKWAVNDFVLQIGAELYVTTGEEDSAYCKYPTWFITKPKSSTKPVINQKLFNVAMKEKRRIHRLRTGKKKVLMKVCGKLLDLFGLKGVALQGLSFLRKLR